MRSQTDRRAAGQNIRPEGRGRDGRGWVGEAETKHISPRPHEQHVTQRSSYSDDLTPQTRVLRAPWSQALIQDDVRLRSRFEICDIETLRREPGS